MRVAVLSNVNVDFLLNDLRKEHDIFRPDGYGTWVQDLVNPRSALATFKPNAVFVLLDGQELVGETASLDDATTLLDSAASYVEAFAQAQPETPLFVSTIDLPHHRITCLKDAGFERHCESAWYARLAGLNRDYGKVYVFDVKRLIEEAGRDTFYSAKLWYAASIKYSLDGHKAILAHIDRCLRAVRGSRKKLIVLDLDNTLWGGILGEEGVDGIELDEHGEGARFKDFQRRLKEMGATGIVLSIASKNNEADAWEAIERNPHMILRRSDFIDPRINWDPKGPNIRSLAETVNLGLDALVFVDDSPVEREAVLSEIPELTIANFPDDSTALPRFARHLYDEHFFTLAVTAEDKKRTAMYQQNQRREESLRAAANYDDFLRSLQTVIRISPPGPSDIARVAQLTQKTNQFNVTTRRYTEPDIAAMVISNRHHVYAVWVDDKFGQNGLVSVVIVAHETPTSARIDTFLMSCRVMSRHVEDQILDHVENVLREGGVRTVYADYLPKRANAPVVGLFDRLGYELFETDAEGGKHYRLDLRAPMGGTRKCFARLVAGVG